MPKKTICEVEFEKWWGERMSEVNPNVEIMAMKARYNSVWNQSWKTCGDKIMESIKRK